MRTPRPDVSTLTATLVGMVGLAAAMGIGRFAFTPLLPLMQERFGLSLLQGGYLASANYLGYLAGALLCVAPGLAPRLLVRLGLVGVALLTAAMGLRNGFAAWTVLRFLAGVASAMVFIGVSAWTLSVLDPAERGPRSGWIYAGVGLGVALAGLVGVGVGAFGLHPSVGWLGLGAAAALVAAGVWRPLSIAPGAGAVPMMAAPARLGREGWRLVLCYGALGFGYIIPATFLPAAARALVNDPTVFGWTWPVFGLAAALSTVVTATLWRNAAPRKVWAASQLVMAVGVLAPALQMNLFTLLLSALCVGGTFMVMTMAGMQEARRVGGAGAPRLIAAMTTALAMGQLVGPLTVRAADSVAEAIRAPSVLAAALLLLSTLLLMAGRGTSVSSMFNTTGNSP